MKCCGCDDRDVAAVTDLGVQEISGPMAAATQTPSGELALSPLVANALPATQSPGTAIALAELGPPGWIILGAFALIFVFGGKHK